MIDCQVPVPGRTTTPLSVCRKPTNNGAALVSCFTTAFRYWSSVVFRHARSHVCADAMPVANAAIKRKRTECLRKRAECIGETSAVHSAPICPVFARFLRQLLVLQCPRCSGRMKHTNVPPLRWPAGASLEAQIQNKAAPKFKTAAFFDNNQD